MLSMKQMIQRAQYLLAGQERE